MLGSERICTSGEPPRKKQKTRLCLRKFQGKWDTTLGTLFVDGCRGYYGDALSDHMVANKFLTNITSSADGNRIRGRWMWASNDHTFGRFEFSLESGDQCFTGTWGWNRRWKGGGFWNGNRYKSKSTLDNQGTNVKSKHAFNTKAVVGSISHTKAMLDYVRRMTAKVQYTFIPTATTEAGGGIRNQRIDQTIRNAPNKGAIPVIPLKPNKHSLAVTKSSQVVPKNLEEISAAEPKLDKSLPTHEAKEDTVSQSPEHTQVIPVEEHQSPAREVAEEPDFEHPDMNENTIEEPELEPEQVPSTDKVVEQETQSELLMIENKCQSNDTVLKDKPNVKLPDTTDNVILSKPQDNQQSKEKAAVEEKEESDEEDLPILTMSKMTSLFTLP